ncbi:MAG: type II-A CRISPR-associated protein Csn2 [Christensenellales bacterium]|jgi:CRISPR type II-A-associated protein Csn2
MTFTYPDIERPFDCAGEHVNTLVVENGPFLHRLMEDIGSQLGGFDGRALVSRDGKVLNFAKSVVLLDRFVLFDINQKPLINRVVSALEKTAMQAEFYERSAEILSLVESYLFDLGFGYPCDIVFPKLSISALLKAAGVQLETDQSSLCAKVLDYMELVEEFDGQKLFITLNLRAFVSEEEIGSYMETALGRGHSLLMIENRDYRRLSCEKRLVIDEDLCEID